MNTQTAVVTGANRGIGLALCQQLAASGAQVVAACRQASDELRALAPAGVRVLEGVDVTDDAVGEVLRAGLGDAPIDLLINNAGLLTRESLSDLDLKRVRRQFEVNTLGPLKVTAALADRLRAGGKVAIITSRMGSIDDNTSGGMYGYRMSKAAVNMAGRSLAHDLKGRGVAVAILHPGFVQTGMTGGRGDVSADVSARGLLARIEALTPETSGRFWHAQGEPLPW